MLIILKSGNLTLQFPDNVWLNHKTEHENSFAIWNCCMIRIKHRHMAFLAGMQTLWHLV